MFHAMPMSSTSLPNDAEALREIIVAQQAQIEQAQSTLEQTQSQLDAQQAQLVRTQSQLENQSEQIRILEEYIRLLKHQRFGASSERAPIDQLGLFNEAEAAADAEDAAAAGEAAETPVAAHTRKKRGRKPLPEVLPRVEILHDLAEAEKVCAEDGHALQEIGREVSEQLEIIPATIHVLRHIRPKYACPKCKTGVKIAPVPPQPIPRSLASPGLLAHVAVSKYVDALPLYRQEAMLSRLGIDLPRATLANWMVKAGQLVVPLVNLIREQLLAGGYLQCDETRFQVLKEAGKRAQSQSYLWAQRGGTEAHPLLLYDYDPSRSGEVPKRLLEGFEGYLQTDGYEGYTAIGSQGGVVHVGCWAHVRRKFDEALQAQGKNRKKGAKRSPKQSKAEQGLRWIGKLYRIEREAAALPAEERHRIRHERARPIVDQTRSWLDASVGSVPPKSLTGKALGYFDKQWPKLIRYLEDGRLRIDTNLVENAIRPFVVGRKNWLFADTVRGAEASANLYSVIETAKANGIEPYAYLRHVFAELPKATTLEDVEALLPGRVDPEALRTAVNP
jgi:transposase